LNTGTTVKAKKNCIFDEMKSTTDRKLKDACYEKNSWALGSVEGPRANAQRETNHSGVTQNDDK
jgi:hypothetical protein